MSMLYIADQFLSIILFSSLAVLAGASDLGCGRGVVNHARSLKTMNTARLRLEAIRTYGRTHACLLEPYEACAATTQPSNPFNFTFVLPELTAPFTLQFTVRAPKDAIIGLATDRREEDIFCHISIGGWWNTKSVIRTGDLRTLVGLTQHAVLNETDQLSSLEDRAFWIEYGGGLLKVGKGVAGAGDGSGVPFMQWNIGSFYIPMPSRVNIAISTWYNASGEWVFDQPCE